MRLAEMSFMREPPLLESSISLSNVRGFLILFSRSLSVRLPLVGVLLIPTSVRPWPKFTVKDNKPSFGRLSVGDSEAWRSRGDDLAVVEIGFELYSERMFMGAKFVERGGYFYAPDRYGPFKEGKAGEIGIVLGGMPMV